MWSFPQPHAWPFPVFVDEDHAGRFEGVTSPALAPENRLAYSLSKRRVSIRRFDAARPDVRRAVFRWGPRHEGEAERGLWGILAVAFGGVTIRQFFLGAGHTKSECNP
jgi:hypothetical protein